MTTSILKDSSGILTIRIISIMGDWIPKVINPDSFNPVLDPSDLEILKSMPTRTAYEICRKAIADMGTRQLMAAQRKNIFSRIEND